MSRTVSKSKKREYAPARTPEAKVSQLINLAFSLAEKKLKDGTASSQVITHFLELATERERLQNEKLMSDLKVADAKIKHMESQSTTEELYTRAIKAFRSYSGTPLDDCEDDQHDEDSSEIF